MKRLLISLTVLLHAGIAAAANHTGSVRAADQFLPGAVITAVQGGARVATATDDQGRYVLELTPGFWRLKVEMFGFLPAERDIEMEMADTSWDWTLEMKRLPPPPAAPLVSGLGDASAPPPGDATAGTRVAAAASPVPAGPAAPGAAPTPAAPGDAARVALAAPPAQPASAVSPSSAAPSPATPGAPPLVKAAAVPLKAKRPPAGQKAPGFQSVTLTATAEGAAAHAIADPATAHDPSPAESGASEAFLVTGSVSQGLDLARRDDERQVKRGGDPAGSDRGAGSFGGGAATPSLAAIFGGEAAGPSFARGGGASAKGGKKLAASKGRRSTTFGNKRKDTDALHGSLSFGLRNSALDARPYSLTGQTVGKPSYARSTFGGSIGGPLILPKLLTLDRTFVFFNFQGTRSRNPYSAVGTLPTALERAGDFSQSVSRWPVQVFDPANHQPFPGNVIPASRFDPVALGLMRFMPMPNQSGRVQNYQLVTSYAYNLNACSLRVNQPLSRKDRLSFSYNRQGRDSVQPQMYGFRDNTGGGGYSMNASYSRTIAPRVINNLSWDFSRNRNDTLPYFAYSSNVADQLGIGGTSEEPINFGPPNLSFTNFGGLSDSSAVLRRDQTSSVTEGITIVLKKKHNLSFGFGYRRMQLNSRAYQNARGSFSFSGLLTSAFDDKGQPLAGTGYDFADFLLGMPQSSSIRFGSDNTYFRTSARNFYGTDDWRLHRGLTLNLGLRYEYFAPYRELFGHMANLDVEPNFTGVAVVTPGTTGPYTGTYGDGLVDPDRNNYSPRAGLAWRPFQKKSTLVRGGYGVFFNGSVYGQFATRMASQPPFAHTASLTTSTARRITLANGFASEPSTTITNTFAVNRYYQVGYAQTFNFAVQQSLPRALVLEAGYQGTKGTHLDIQRLPNRAMPGSPLTAEQRRQIGNAVGFTYEDSNGNSILHSGQLRLTRRFQKGLSANALYTFAKSIDNVSTFGGGGTTVAQNDKDLRSERGLSSFDQRHNLAVNWVLSSPVNQNGLLRNGGRLAKVLADWTLSGGLIYASGTPMTARVLGNLANSGGTGAIGSGRADAVGTAGIQDGGYRFFNLAAFGIPPSGRYGNAGRNTIPGPSRIAVNASLGRTFRLGDASRRNIDLRCDTGNSTNHAAFTTLGTVINAANYGLPLGTLPMRSVNLSLRFRF